METTLVNTGNNTQLELRNRAAAQLGFEQVDRDDLLIPRLCISQALSPQLKKNHENYLPDLRPGEFFNSLTGEIYGEVLELIPLFFFKQFIKFRPMEEGGGVIRMYNHQSEVPAAELAWGPNNEKPTTTKILNFMALLLKKDGTQELIVASFSKTATPVAKKIISLGRAAQVPMFERYYRLTHIEKQGKAFTWEGCKVEILGSTPETFIAAARSYFGELNDNGFKFDTEGIQEEVSDSGQTTQSQDTPF